jgi:hypothetical protein
MLNFIVNNKKMKNKIKYSAFFLFTAAIILTIGACSKEGKGGKSSVNGNVKHHSKLIPNAIVYIKYGATEFPGTDVSLYDDQITSDTNAHFEFRDLEKGDYYLYGVGFDNALMEAVKGGVSVSLKYDKSTSTDVPVTE